MIVKLIPNIFEPATRSEKEIPFEGLTLREILSKYFGLPIGGLAAMINSGEAKWDDVPAADDEVIFAKDISGKYIGGALSFLGGLVLTVVGFVVPGAQFLIPAGVAMMAGAVVGTAAQLLFTPQGPAKSSGFDSSQTYAWGGINNVIGEGNVVPVVYGAHKVGGAVIQAFVDGFNDDKGNRVDYLNILLALSEGEIHSIDADSIFVNNKELSFYGPDYSIGTRLGTINQEPLITDIAKYYAMTGAIKIVKASPYVYKTFAPNIETKIHLSLPALFHSDDKGNFQAQQVYVKVYKARADAPNTWYPVTAGELVYKKTIGSGWLRLFDYTVTDPNSTLFRIEKCSKSEVLYDISVAGYSDTETLIKIERDSDDFSPGDQYNAGDLYIKAATEYEFGVAPGYMNTALLCLKMLATNKISGQMPTFTVNVVGRKIKDVRDLNAAPTVAGAKNPANILYDILTNTRYGMGNVVGAGKIDLPSFQDFADWCDESVDYEAKAKDGTTSTGTQKRYEMNLVLDSRHKANDLAQQICGVCRAIPYWSGDKLKIVVERPQSTYSQIFNMANIVKGSFEETYIGISQVPNQIEVNFLNEDDDFKQTPLIAIDKARVNENVNTKALQLYGLTNAARSKREVVFAMKKAKGLRRLIKFNTTIQALVTEVGDLFHFQHDVPQYGFGGGVVSTNGAAVTFDKNVWLENGKTHGCRIQKADGTLLYYTTAPFAGASGEYSAVTFSSTIDVGVAAGDLYQFGPVNKESKPFRLLTALRQEDNTIELNAEEYNATIFNEDANIDVSDVKYSSLGLVTSYTFDGSLPPDNRVAGGGADQPDGRGTEYDVPPIVNSVVLSEDYSLVGTYFQTVIFVSFGDVFMAPNSRARVSRYEILVRRENEGAAWTKAGEVAPGVGSFRISGVDVGKKYYVVVKPYTNYGVSNHVETDPNYTSLYSITLLGPSAKPNAPTGLLLDYADVFEIGIKWTPPSLQDVLAVEIWMGTTNVRADSVMVGKVPASTSKFVKTGLVFDTDYWFWVRTVNTNVGTPVYGDWVGPLATATLATPSGLITALTGNITEGMLATELQTKINNNAELTEITARVTAAEADIVAAEAALFSLDGRLDTAETSITAAEAAIILKASQTALDTTNSNLTTLTGRVSQAEIDIDAAEAAIILKASQTQVTGLASDLTTLTGRVSQAEIDINAAEAAIVLKANQTDLSGLTSRVSQAEIDIDAAEAAIILKASQAQVTSIAGDLTTLTGRVSTAEIDINAAEAAIVLKASQSSLDTTNTNVAAAQAAANAAQTAANNAQTSANTANNLLADIASDSRLTPDEKQATKKEWDQIVANKPIRNAQATAYGLTTENNNYNSAYNVLNTYITPLLASLTTTSNIDGVAFRANFKGYYDAEVALLRAVADLAKSTADTAATNAAAAQTAAANAQTSANNAVTTANAAQTTANNVNALVSDIASDSKFTPVEKQAVKLEWDLIVANKPLRDTQATQYGITTEKTTYDNAYASLSTYITPLLASLTTTSDIVGSTFRANFKAYYDAEVALLQAIVNAAKAAADVANANAAAAQGTATSAQAAANAAQIAASTAQAAANTAQAAADSAQTAANTANALLADIASDGKFTPAEKQATKLEWDLIVSNKTQRDTQADTYGLTTEKTAYDNAYDALSTYVTPLLADLATTSNIVGATFRTNFKTYYDAETALLKAIADRAKQLADAAQSAANTAQAAANTAQTTANNVSAEMTLAKSEWLVKLNANGHVAGVGLLLDPLSGASDFIVLADKFAVMAPDGSGTPKVPFVVGNVNGVSMVGVNGDLIVAGTVTAEKFESELYGDLSQALHYVKVVLGAGDEYDHPIISGDLTGGALVNIDPATTIDYGVSIRLASQTLWDEGGAVWDSGSWDRPVESSGSWTSASLDLGVSKTLQMALLYTLSEDSPAATAEAIKTQYSVNGSSWGANSPNFDDGLWETLTIAKLTGNIYRATGTLNTFRYFKMKVELTTSDTTKNIVLYNMSILGNVVNIFGYFADQTIAAGGTSFTLKGFGTVPAITVTPIGATPLVPVVVSQSAGSITVKLYNLAGSSVGGQANITIIGA